VVWSVKNTNQKEFIAKQISLKHHINVKFEIKILKYIDKIKKTNNDESIKNISFIKIKLSFNNEGKILKLLL